MTPLEIYLNVLAEVEYLQSLPGGEGGVTRGEEFYLACDLRPSSPELAVAAVRALRDAGMKPVNCGRIPTPALTYFALAEGKGSLMITGSHIPFNRNGYKLNTSRGELLKHHEEPINARVAAVRQRLYEEGAEGTLFDGEGRFKVAPGGMPEEVGTAEALYLDRYLTFFSGK